MNSKPYFSTYVEDLEQTPFDSVGFVERLTWRINDGKEDDFDAGYLKRKFEEEIGSLQASIENFQIKVQRLEDQQSTAKHRYLDSLQRLHDRNSDALDRLKVRLRTFKIMYTLKTWFLAIGHDDAEHFSKSRTSGRSIRECSCAASQSL
jgi:hypothetical protein